MQKHGEPTPFRIAALLRWVKVTPAFMKYSKSQLWQRVQKYSAEYPELGLAVDPSRMHLAFGDYLSGLLLGTRQALYDNDRDSVTLAPIASRG